MYGPLVGSFEADIHIGLRGAHLIVIWPRSSLHGRQLKGNSALRVLNLAGAMDSGTSVSGMHIGWKPNSWKPPYRSSQGHSLSNGNSTHQDSQSKKESVF